MSNSSYNNLKLNFIFLITIFRLEICKTLDQNSNEQFNSNFSQTNESVLISDELTTSIYSNTIIIESSTRSNEDGDKSIDFQGSVTSNDELKIKKDENFDTTTRTTIINNLSTKKPQTNLHQLTRDEWLAKEYFSYLCGMKI